MVGINGFGRIGRYFLRVALTRGSFEVKLINDLTDIKTLAHLLKYDSIHGPFPIAFSVEGDEMVFDNGARIKCVSHRNPEEIPWREAGVEIVLESTGLFRSKELASKHLQAGAKKVIISAPAKDDVKTVVLGVNDEELSTEDVIISNASCTTNNAAPLVAVMRELATISSAYITTVHSYTSDQRLHDSPHSDLRRARAANLSIIPTSTGAAKAITKIFPDLSGKIGGCGIRVPVPNGSMTDLTMICDNPPEASAINLAMKKASETHLKGILGYTEDPIVSTDIIGSSYSCLFDAELTSVIGNMVKIVGWYDNEAGYSHRLVDLVERIKA